VVFHQASGAAVRTHKQPQVQLDIIDNSCAVVAGRAMSAAQEATVVRDTWYFIEPLVLPFAHTNNPKYNWTSLTIPALL